MSTVPELTMQAADWLNLFIQFMSLSLLSIGGAITATSDMHRFLVDQHHWLNDAQFNASIAIAQAAPGPNVLFVALMGWNVGLNAGGFPTALLGMTATMTGILLPSTTLTYYTSQWGHRNRNLRSVRAFKLGMTPIVIALLVATGWVLAGANDNPSRDWPLWVVTAITTLIVWRTKLHLLWLLAAGAALGWFGFI